jgi:hypothetical protein
MESKPIRWCFMQKKRKTNIKVDKFELINIIKHINTVLKLTKKIELHSKEAKVNLKKIEKAYGLKLDFNV